MGCVNSHILSGIERAPMTASFANEFKYYPENYVSSGSFGCVYKGQRKSDNLDVAIKRLKNCYDGFIEKNTLDYLRHKNIVHLEAFFVLEDRMFLVMECGKCDMKFASLCNKLVLADILHIAGSTLEALKFIHARGFIHCDVKLSNMILTFEGKVKLADFGAARRHPYMGIETGTIYFNAPEQIRSNWDIKDFGPAVDIYAFGITVIELLDGMVPNSHLPRLGFINIMMRSDFVAPTVRGIRKMWHREVFGDMIAQALNICVRHRATAAHLLDIVHELEGFKVRY